ncbi:histidine phosphatase family protein [Trueperella bernardiae]|uniref:SixA phosphatase family protein n=1 Tax=Trueperella bernardiae TaxID=59561 RepID=UPI00294A3FFF|nr:histidine phosphatase family protein [Trueperella bernardiae]MDV6238019.1 histidine phosphatase family protein [Trueperella bernardiae]
MLIIMRHAKAGHGSPDHARPLTDHGRRQAGFVGGAIDRAVGEVDQLFVSDAARTLQTLESLTSGGLVVKERFVEPSLYSAGGDDVVELLRVAANGRVVMMVGHEPTMSAVSYQLWDRVGEAGFASGFPTAGAAIFGGGHAWEELSLGSLPLQAFIRAPM